jgi:hypothetical protein
MAVTFQDKGHLATPMIPECGNKRRPADKTPDKEGRRAECAQSVRRATNSAHNHDRHETD